MSILIVEVVPQGIIMGADRNITEAEGGQILGQGQRPKVLRWPKKKALIGYVGVAEIDGMPTDEWLYDFIGDNIDFNNFDELSRSLCERVEEQRRIDEAGGEVEPLIIHLAGFQEGGGSLKPFIGYIRNAYALGPDGYEDFRKEFQYTEEFWQPPYFGQFNLQQARDILQRKADNYEPFWFHQGLDLGLFNTIKGSLNAAFRFICARKPELRPTTLNGWEQQVKMSILTYGAFYQAFKNINEQFVGGGADVLSIPWPI